MAKITRKWRKAVLTDLLSIQKTSSPNVRIQEDLNSGYFRLVTINPEDISDFEVLTQYTSPSRFRKMINEFAKGERERIETECASQELCDKERRLEEELADIVWDGEKED